MKAKEILDCGEAINAILKIGMDPSVALRISIATEELLSAWEKTERLKMDVVKKRGVIANGPGQYSIPNEVAEIFEAELEAFLETEVKDIEFTINMSDLSGMVVEGKHIRALRSHVVQDPK